MKPNPKKGGHGHVTSYVLSIGSAEAKQAGFIDESGNPVEIIKIIDAENKTIIFKVKT